MADAILPQGMGGKPVGRTASREVRRQQLIDATIESISRHGIPGTTMTTVTGLAGLSLGLVNFHFKTKKSLFEETLRYLALEYREHWQGRVAKAGDGAADRLRAMVEAHFEPIVCNRRKLTVWFAFYGEAAYRGAYREIMCEMDPERWNIVTAMCASIIEEGAYEGTSPDNVADTLEGLYDGFCLNILMYPDEYPPETAKARVLGYLAGVFPQHFTDVASACSTPCRQGSS